MPFYEAILKKDPLFGDLRQLILTHAAISANLPHEQMQSLRRPLDPSLPNIFYCQRLLVSLDPTADDIRPWLEL